MMMSLIISKILTKTKKIEELNLIINSSMFYMKNPNYLNKVILKADDFEKRFEMIVILMLNRLIFFVTILRTLIFIFITH